MPEQPFLFDRDEGAAIWFAGSLVLVRLTGEETGGAYSLLEQHGDPGFETPYHVHHDEREVFYVTDGTIRVFTEDGAFEATRGQTVVLPRGEPHGFRVIGDSPGRILVLCSPPGLEAFFREAGEPAAERAIPERSETDEDEIESLASKYEVEILGPLPDRTE